jgi:hypothetical protein
MPKPAEVSDRRAATAAAFEQHEQEQESDTEAAPEQDAAAAPDVEADAGVAAVAGGDQDDAAPAEDDNASDDGRDEKGRFKAKKAAEDAAAAKAAAELEQPTDGEPPAQEPAQAAANEPKAPSSWKPAAREKWAKLDPDVKAEISRVDKEVRKTMQEAALVKKSIEAVDQTIAPFEHLIRTAQAARGEQYNPLQTIGTLLRTAAQLQVGSPQDQAQIVASLIKTHRIPLDVVNEALGFRVEQQDPEADAEGGEVEQPQPRPVRRQQPQQHAQAPGEFHDPRLDSLLEKARVDQEARNAAVIESFKKDPKNEFFEDVRVEMAALMEAAESRGQKMGMQEAYDRAVRADPELWKIVEQRRAIERVKKQSQSNQRAKAAAASVPSSPTGARPEGAPADRRSSLVQAWAENEGRL